MTISNSRRKFIKLAGMVSVGFSGLQHFVNTPGLSAHQRVSGGYGPLIDDPKGVLNLPEGFSYKIISKAKQIMDDGLRLPGLPDGMATFLGPGNETVVIRNHEISPDTTKLGPYGKKNKLVKKLRKEDLYDFGRGEMPCLGGTTTFVFDEDKQKIEKQFLSLAGTIRNCAGGPTPWNSWISCEEDVRMADDILEKDHGYPFEVPVTLNPGPVKPEPLTAMGRFNHEAVAVDPRTSIVYQTEDRGDGLIYRFIPHEKGQLSKGGKLQALAVKGQKSVDTRNWDGLDVEKIPVGKKMPVSWIDLDDIHSPKDDLRYRGFESGAARFARGEGIWFGKNECYFACTNGGHISEGQVFRYIPSEHEGTAKEVDNPGYLELFAEPNDANIVRNCDNLTIAPWGDIILCEDNKSPSIVGLTPKGEFYQFAKNVGYETEFAGATFSPSGKTLFVNIQGAGLTLAITGPWSKVSS